VWGKVVRNGFPALTDHQLIRVNMNMSQELRSVSRLLILMFMGIALVACGPSDEEKAAAAQQATVKKRVKKVEPTDPLAGMASAVTGSKGTLPVDVHFELLDRPEPNKPVNVRLALVPTMDLIAMHAVVKPMTGLQVGEDSQAKFDTPKNGEIKEYKFTVTPTDVGIFLANIEITVTRDTGDTTFLFSVPVPVPEKTPSNVATATVTNK